MEVVYGLSQSFGEPLSEGGVDVIEPMRAEPWFRSPMNSVRGITFSTNEWRESRFRVRLYDLWRQSIPLIAP